MERREGRQAFERRDEMEHMNKQARTYLFFIMKA